MTWLRSLGVEGEVGGKELTTALLSGVASLPFGFFTAMLVNKFLFEIRCASGPFLAAVPPPAGICGPAPCACAWKRS